MPLVITTQSRPTPYLQEYLHYLVFQPMGQMWKTGVFGIVGGVVGGLFAGGIGVAIAAAMNMGIGPIIACAVGIPLAVIAGVGAYVWKLWRKQEAQPDYAMTKEARDIGHQIQHSASNRRLYREMHPAAIDLLEESARCWKRTNDAVNGPFWKSKDLPDHYQTIRQQAMVSADRAMMEILINLRSAVRPVGEPQTMIEGIQHALESVGIQISTGVGKDEPLPMGFEKAADLAHNLAELATEVEQASVQAIKTSAGIPMGSSESIRETLESLKQVRAAESELDQDLHVGS